WIDQLPGEARPYLRRLREDFLTIQQRLRTVQPRHVSDALDFASRAWRRPLRADENAHLQTFYAELRGDAKLDHTQAMRAMIARILIAPEFLYRAERAPQQAAAIELSDWELASRLSFLIWSSLPDEELRRAAESGKLRDEA